MEGYQKLVIYATIIMLGALITVFTFDTWQTVLIVTLLLILINYLIVLSLDKVGQVNFLKVKEGFTTETDAASSKYEWLGNDDLFDDFYASVFTKLTQNENLIQAETAICMEEFSRNTPKDQLTILDAGCGVH
jgi:hypothetical protein